MVWLAKDWQRWLLLEARLWWFIPLIISTHFLTITKYMPEIVWKKKLLYLWCQTDDVSVFRFRFPVAPLVVFELQELPSEYPTWHERERKKCMIFSRVLCNNRVTKDFFAYAEIFASIFYDHRVSQKSWKPFGKCHFFQWKWWLYEGFTLVWNSKIEV